MLSGRKYFDRFEAGRVLAQSLQRYRGVPDLLVLGLPRGGIPVAFEVARFLNAPLDVFVVRKLGVPGHEELAMGAIASGGIAFFDQRLIDVVPQKDVDSVIVREASELTGRERAYRDHRPPQDAKNKTVILVDDGLATGASMQAAVRALHTLSPRKIVVAVPVASAEACASLAEAADEVVCPLRPEMFYAVGQWYEDFSQVSDSEVRALLERAAARSEGKGTSLEARL
jgi:putative phosphoribosyl transferase